MSYTAKRNRNLAYMIYNAPLVHTSYAHSASYSAPKFSAGDYQGLA